ncbi:hypothetical protein IEQ34_011231 [Dendrobium chrysotoxum]|uniref:Allene oxide synthase n=1 Tax=Dendrobium chrysotoxum TaxID=161865 RepID=A0AAV7GXY4_DENCH|nr:hypothetical protein IEQ34_011231 [Dendrobium chrysotoxum]
MSSNRYAWLDNQQPEQLSASIMSSNRYPWLDKPQPEQQAPLLLPTKEWIDKPQLEQLSASIMSTNRYPWLDKPQPEQQAPLLLPTKEWLDKPQPEQLSASIMSTNRYPWLDKPQSEQQAPVLLPTKEWTDKPQLEQLSASIMSSNRYPWLDNPQPEQQAPLLLPTKEWLDKPQPEQLSASIMSTNRYPWLDKPQPEQQAPLVLPTKEWIDKPQLEQLSASITCSNRYPWLDKPQPEQQAPLLLPTKEWLDKPQSEQQAPLLLPTKKIPGSYGIPFISPIKDRLDYYYFKGHDNFFQSKINQYSSTVFRTNMIPGPLMASNPRVIAVLDAKSFPILFDTSKVEKKNVFTGTYMPSTKLTGGYRVCSYLDPSEPTHAKVKQFLFNLLKSRKDYFLPAFRSAYVAPIFSSVESQVATHGHVDFNALNNDIAFDFLGEAYFGERPSKEGMFGSCFNFQKKVTIWLLLQLAPLASNILTKFLIPKLVEDFLLHTFAFPSFIAQPGYKSMYEYFNTAGSAALDLAEKVGLSRDEACHNLIFATCFNTYGGLRVLFPGLLKRLAQSGRDLHARLATEVRQAVATHGENGQVTLGALEQMELANSVVYEVLRIDPPVEFQYAHAKKDFLLQSHDAQYQVRKGEMLFGYQPFATRDKRVFGANAGEFVPDRFVGSDGAKLLRYVWWSNGPETQDPTVNDKQCAGKNFVVLVARLFVAEFFLRYDSFTAEISSSVVGAQVNITSITKAKAKAHASNFY